MTVRAKFYVDHTEHYTWATKVVARAVTRGDDNKEWSAATPVGLIELTIKNEHAAEQFVPGQEYFVDFTPVPANLTGAEGMGE